MLTCEVPPTSGTIVFEGRDITGMTMTDACQLGLTKSYQVNQLFNRLTVRQNLTIAVLAELPGKFRLARGRLAESLPGRAGKARPGPAPRPPAGRGLRAPAARRPTGGRGRSCRSRLAPSGAGRAPGPP